MDRFQLKPQFLWMNSKAPQGASCVFPKSSYVATSTVLMVQLFRYHHLFTKHLCNPTTDRDRHKEHCAFLVPLLQTWELNSVHFYASSSNSHRQSVSVCLLSLSLPPLTHPNTHTHNTIAYARLAFLNFMLYCITSEIRGMCYLLELRNVL